MRPSNNIHSQRTFPVMRRETDDRRDQALVPAEVRYQPGKIYRPDVPDVTQLAAAPNMYFGGSNFRQVNMSDSANTVALAGANVDQAPIRTLDARARSAMYDGMLQAVQGTVAGRTPQSAAEEIGLAARDPMLRQELSAALLKQLNAVLALASLTTSRDFPTAKAAIEALHNLLFPGGYETLALCKTLLLLDQVMAQQSGKSVLPLETVCAMLEALVVPPVLEHPDKELVKCAGGLVRFLLCAPVEVTTAVSTDVGDSLMHALAAVLSSPNPAAFEAGGQTLAYMLQNTARTVDFMAGAGPLELLTKLLQAIAAALTNFPAGNRVAPDSATVAVLELATLLHRAPRVRTRVVLQAAGRDLVNEAVSQYHATVTRTLRRRLDQGLTSAAPGLWFKPQQAPSTSAAAPPRSAWGGAEGGGGGGLGLGGMGAAISLVSQASGAWRWHLEEDLRSASASMMEAVVKSMHQAGTAAAAAAAMHSILIQYRGSPTGDEGPWAGLVGAQVAGALSRFPEPQAVALTILPDAGSLVVSVALALRDFGPASEAVQRHCQEMLMQLLRGEMLARWATEVQHGSRGFKEPLHRLLVGTVVLLHDFTEEQVATFQPSAMSGQHSHPARAEGRAAPLPELVQFAVRLCVDALVAVAAAAAPVLCTLLSDCMMELLGALSGVCLNAEDVTARRGAEVLQALLEHQPVITLDATLTILENLSRRLVPVLGPGGRPDIDKSVVVGAAAAAIRQLLQGGAGEQLLPEVLRWDSHPAQGAGAGSAAGPLSVADRLVHGLGHAIMMDDMIAVAQALLALDICVSQADGHGYRRLVGKTQAERGEAAVVPVLQRLCHLLHAAPRRYLVNQEDPAGCRVDEQCNQAVTRHAAAVLCRCIKDPLGRLFLQRLPEAAQNELVEGLRTLAGQRYNTLAHPGDVEGGNVAADALEALMQPVHMAGPSVAPIGTVPLPARPAFTVPQPAGLLGLGWMGL